MDRYGPDERPEVCEDCHHFVDSHDRRGWSDESTCQRDCEDCLAGAATIHYSGRWSVRISSPDQPMWRHADPAPKGESAYRGSEVEVYDARFAGNPHFPQLGQFVSAYYVSTLRDNRPTALVLQSDIPSWWMTPDETGWLLRVLDTYALGNPTTYEPFDRVTGRRWVEGR